jgi:hypothetical protein
VCGAYAITYSIYLNVNAAHTYPYYIFYLNGPLKLIILDLVYCSEHIFPIGSAALPNLITYLINVVGIL